VRFFPKVGHFFLLGTPEGKVHLFDIVRTKTCARSYMGHTKAIRDVQFSHDGKHFLSASFDNKILYWDTEYGKGISIHIQWQQLSLSRIFLLWSNSILLKITQTYFSVAQILKRFINLIC